MVSGIRAASPDTAIVVYTAFDDPITAEELTAAGAVAVLRKGDRGTDVVAAIAAAGEGHIEAH